MPWQLVPEADDRQTVPIDKAILFFGRHPECDVVITSSRKVSRKHCCVAQVEGKLVVRDLGSMNGVRVNGKTVRRDAPLRLGDSFTVGDVVFHLTEAPGKGKQSGSRRVPENPKRPPPPSRDLSQDIPVVISEESESFAVEDSIRRRAADRPESSIILSASDIVDDGRDSWFNLPVAEES